MASSFPWGEELIISESESDIVIPDLSQLCVGSIVRGRGNLSEVIKELMVYQKKRFVVDQKYKGGDQVKWVCSCKTCNAHVRARRKNNETDEWCIISSKISHFCDSVMNYAPSLIASLPFFLTSIENNINITASDLQLLLSSKNIAPTIQQIYKAKALAKKIIEQNYKEDFYRLIPFLKLLHAANPNSVYKIELDDNNMLNKCFFGVDMKDIITASLPLSSADGTYSRDPFTKGVWLSFNILTSNNKLV